MATTNRKLWLGHWGVLLHTNSFSIIHGHCWLEDCIPSGWTSVLVGVLVCLFANDPRFCDSDDKDKAQTSFLLEVKELVKEAKAVMKIPSFQIIVAQGVSGSFAGSSYSFIPMWLELIGFSHNTTGFLWTIFIVGFSVGGLFGGRMGDILAKRLPNSGRIILSQISAGSAIPLAAILLLVLPDDPSTAFLHGLVFLFMGLSTSWNGPATNKIYRSIRSSKHHSRNGFVLFADIIHFKAWKYAIKLAKGISYGIQTGSFAGEIVRERSRTSIYALDQSFESIFASFAPPVVGILAQHVYGYKPVPKGSTNSQEIATDRANAAVLAKALYTAIGIPFTICCLIYSFLYCTYPRDRERAILDALVESEMHYIETDNIPAGEEYFQLHVLGSEHAKGRNVSEIDNEGEEGLDFDDNDEKRLLTHQLTFSDLAK